jgi:endonuclease/exonuclease/phosphatase family metal-dependent hydrolase
VSGKSNEPFQFSKIAEELISDLRGVPNQEPARQRKRPTKSVADLMEQLLTKHQIGRASPEQAIRDRWPELVGAANAHYSHAVLIDPRGKLVIIASHAVVRQELTMHRRTIVARIQKVPGCEHVKDLSIRAG